MKNLKLTFKRDQEERFLKTQEKEADFMPAGRSHFVQWEVLLGRGERVCAMYIFRELLWSEYLCLPKIYKLKLLKTFFSDYF